MHPEKGMIFLGFAKFFLFSASLYLYFVVKFAYLDCYVSFSSFCFVNTISFQVIV